MPMTWTPDADRRLLLLVLEITNVNKGAIAQRWAEKYTAEGGDQPTVRAITERLFKLKQMADGKGSNAGTPKKTLTPRDPRATPSIAKKAKPKTPASSSKKRGKKAAMSDEDDHSENNMDFTEESPTKRARLERRSKTPKRYEDPGSEVEDEEAGEASTVNATSSKVTGGDFDGDDGDLSRDHGFAMDDFSDISDFKPVV